MNEYLVLVQWEMRNGKEHTISMYISATTPEDAMSIMKKFVRASSSKTRGKFVQMKAFPSRRDPLLQRDE